MPITKTPVRTQHAQQTQQSANAIQYPRTNIKKYVPREPKTNSNFQDRSTKWISPAALQVYDPLLINTVPGTFAWIPMPMFNSQDPTRFCDTRYSGNDMQFDEWSWGTPLVRLAGTDRQRAITFCPYNQQLNGTEDFISSPYAALYNFVTSMDRERKFAEHNPWWHLINLRKDGTKYIGNYLPKIQQYYLMVSILLAAVKNVYNRDTKTASNIQEVYYNPATLGKGLAAGEKLILLAVSTQIWQDLVKTMNTRTPAGDWLYPDVCDPDHLAVMYAWKHKASPQSPVPGVVSMTQIDGMSGTVSGQLYDVFAYGNPQVPPVCKQFSLPPQFLTPQKGPSQAYFDKIPMHVGETINYMDDYAMIKELALAFADAKAIFDLAFKQTDFEQYLDEPDIKAIFGATPQKVIYDSSIFAGAPSHHQVTQPAYSQSPAQQQQYQPPNQQQYQSPVHNPAVQQMINAGGAAIPPGQQYQASGQHQYQPPNQQQYQPPQSNPFPDTNAARAAGAAEPITEIYEDENGYAVDINGQFILDQHGRMQRAEDLAAAMDQPNW